ncbi:MAG: amidohydrolase [Rhodospirillaceae bacterium]|nr:amidohydrolase [Rhodospirillaceae bacterium]
MVVRSSNAEWLESLDEDILEPELPIIDPHHHLWDKNVHQQVQPRYLLDEILEDINCGHNIVSTVFIECGAMFKQTGPEHMRPVGETEFVNGIAAMSASGLYGKTRVADAIIGTVDLRIGALAGDVLDAHISAGGGRFRGIRRAVAWDKSKEIRNHRTDPPEGLLLSDDYRMGFAELGPRELTFEAWCYHTQIPEVTNLARSFPDTIIILDHFGGPLGVGPYEGRSNEIFRKWKADIKELTSCPNVFAKLGGINMDVNGFGWHQRSSPPTSEGLMAATRHYYEFTIEAFGPNRCMFESNFPVDKLSCSYKILWNTFKRIASGASNDEKNALFHDTAAKVYNI